MVFGGHNDQFMDSEQASRPLQTERPRSALGPTAKMSSVSIGNRLSGCHEFFARPLHSSARFFHVVSGLNGQAAAAHIRGYVALRFVGVSFFRHRLGESRSHSGAAFWYLMALSCDRSCHPIYLPTTFLTSPIFSWTFPSTCSSCSLDRTLRFPLRSRRAARSCASVSCSIASRRASHTLLPLQHPPELTWEDPCRDENARAATPKHPDACSIGRVGHSRPYTSHRSHGGHRASARDSRLSISKQEIVQGASCSLW